MDLQFDIEHLVTAATQVGGHGEDLASRHLHADNQLESAAAGWTGRSALALANRAECWRRQSTALVGRVGEHATDLHSAAIGFAVMEQHNAAALSLPALLDR